jgi:hypothetical protein
MGDRHAENNHLLQGVVILKSEPESNVVKAGHASKEVAQGLLPGKNDIVNFVWEALKRIQKRLQRRIKHSTCFEGVPSSENFTC